MLVFSRWFCERHLREMILYNSYKKNSGALLLLFFIWLFSVFFTVRVCAAETAADNGLEGATEISVKKVLIKGAIDYPELGVSSVAVAAFANAELAKYENQLTMGQLQKLVNGITSYYVDRGLIFNRAYLPPQEIADDSITINILEGKLGDVHLLDKQQYTGDAPTVPFDALLDKPIVEREIKSALARANDVPGLAIYGFFSKGGGVGETDLNLNIMDERKHYFAVDLDNYGAKTTGEKRITIVSDWYRLLTEQGVLSLRLTASDTSEKYIFGSLGYRSQFLDYKNFIETTVSSNDYTVGGSARSLGLEGRVNSLSIKVEQRWHRRDDYNLISHIEYSFRDFMQNSALFGDALDREESVHKLTLSTASNWSTAKAGHYSLGGHLAYGDPNINSGYLRAEEKIDSYWLAKLSLSYNRGFFQHTQFSQQLEWALSSQYVDAPLPSVDLFSLTGAQYVRAYDAGLASVDKGVLSRLHWHFPHIRRPLLGQSLLFRGFALLDYAYGSSYLNDTDAGSESWTEVVGGGFGLHAELGRHVRLDFTLAKPFEWKGGLHPGEDENDWNVFLKLHWSRAY